MEIYTYSDFLKDKTALTFEEAGEIYNNLVSSLNTKDPDFLENWTTLIELAAQYTELRVRSETIPLPKREQNDISRKSTHKAFISQLKVIKYFSENDGKNTNWFDQITNDRQRQGDFANYLAYIYSVNTRKNKYKKF
ncbi:hypothetical protein SPAR5_0296 [Streptococcus pneumoniae GA04375]|nr:hypothetical protein SPAR5_0296 [Streptococcus pneumoniae GA04375]EHE18918.1 hypothetical protein SPAR58_0328 [Streptococcus pneumoniae GA19451]EOB24834.1 hypothetical protein D062_10001 [Streptococcus pneumoniae 1542]